MKAAMLFVVATAVVGTIACAHGYEFKGGDDNQACVTSLFDNVTCQDEDDEVLGLELDGGSEAVDAPDTDADVIETSSGCDA